MSTPLLPGYPQGRDEESGDEQGGVPNNNNNNNNNNGFFTRIKQGLFWVVLTLISLPWRTTSMLSRHFSGNYLCSSSHFLFRLWKFMVLLAVTVVSWTSLYVLCFTHVHEMTLTFGWRVFDYTMFVVFLIDHLVSCNTPYTDENTNARIIDRYQICKHHLISWELLDFIVSIPVSVLLHLPVLILAKPIVSTIWILVRVVQVRKLLFTQDIPRPALLCFITVFSIHIISCGFYFIARDNPNVTKTWVNLEKDEADNETSWAFPYIMSFYWATTSFTTVGYGDIHPINSVEMLYCIVVMIFSTGLLTWISSAILDFIKAYFTPGNHINAVRKFCLANSLSKDLKDEMIDNLTHRGMADVEIKEGFGILSLFSKQLQSRIKTNLFIEHLQELYIFHRVSPAFMFQLVAELEVEMFGPNEVVILANEFPSKVYFCWKGGVVRESEIVELGVCGEVGTLCFVSQPYTFRTVSSSILLSISRITLLRLFELHRGELKILLENVMVEVFDKDQSILNDAVVQQSFLDMNIFLPIASLITNYSKAIMENNLNLLTMAHTFSGGQVDIFIPGSKETPLILAVRRKNIEAAEYLMRHHARSDIPDSTGSTARELAISGGSEEMRQLFLRYRA